MFLEIEGVLTGEELAEARKLAREITFIDGRASNPHNVAKQNLQADMAVPAAQRASQIASAAMGRNEQLRNFVFPKRIAPPLLSRYDVDMKYGVHSDAPQLSFPNGMMRSDVSATLFVSDPATYDGGELVIHLGNKKIAVKGEPGTIILYPSTTLHEVRQITAGERLAFFTFMESVVADQARRELLHTLNEVYALEGLKMAADNRTRLQHTINNLLRMWSAD